MLNRVVFQKFLESDFPSKEWKHIRAVCKQVCLASVDETPAKIKDADALFVKLGATVDRQLIDSAPGLRIIGMFGTGYGRIDIDYARKKNIVVFNVADYATHGVAEFVFGALLNRARDLPRALTQSAAGNYSDTSFMGTQLYGKTIGILGLGAIGTRVAEIADGGFGMNVLYWSRKRKKSRETKHIRYAEIGDVLAKSDYVSLHLALTPDTKSLLSASKIARMRSQTILVNTAPMELVDLSAVEKRLAKNDFTFILDHSDEMPPKDLRRLSRLSNCIIYPPIAYLTHEAAARKQSIFVDNIVAAGNGRKIPNRVN